MTARLRCRRLLMVLAALVLLSTGASASSIPPLVVPGVHLWASSSLVSKVRAGLWPSPVAVGVVSALKSEASLLPLIYGDGCHANFVGTVPPPCVFGSLTASTSVWLVGDSHAAQWFPALTAVATARSWRLVSLTKSACEPVLVAIKLPTGAPYPQCATWNRAVLGRIATERPTVVIVSAQAMLLSGVESSFGAYVRIIRASGAKVIALGDTPEPSVDVPRCVSAHLSNQATCALARTVAVMTTEQAAMSGAATHAGAHVVTTAGWICAPSACPVIIDGTLVYRDSSHLSVTAADRLAGLLDGALRPFVPLAHGSASPSPTLHV